MVSNKTDAVTLVERVDNAFLQNQPYIMSTGSDLLSE